MLLLEMMTTTEKISIKIFNDIYGERFFLQCIIYDYSTLFKSEYFFFVSMKVDDSYFKKSFFYCLGLGFLLFLH